MKNNLNPRVSLLCSEISTIFKNVACIRSVLYEKAKIRFKEKERSQNHSTNREKQAWE
jgi:hypothetical protein